jgi:CDP-glucose 4,6-dehydratase
MASFELFRGASVLVTGHTGFKGTWLSLWLKKLGANVSGVSIDIPSEPSHFRAAKLSEQIDDHRLDIRDGDALKKIFQEVQPDYVFHMAAQSLVSISYEKPIFTIGTNALGTANVLDALRKLDKKVVAVMITSDKVYKNEEWVWGYREIDRLGGKDPYSASKGMAELVIRSYVESFFNAPNSNVRVGISRAGNVIGGGDWAADRIVPDCIKAWSKNKTVEIRNPGATRPWQHVLEPLSGYLTLGKFLYYSSEKHGEAYNFGPPANQNHPVIELIEEMAKCWDHVRWNDISLSKKNLQEAGLLKLNCDKALLDLKWMPTLKFEETVGMTVKWYKSFFENDNNTMYEFSMQQIEEYTKLAKKRGITWACE